MEPIVDRKIFASAQLLLNETWALSDTDLLDYLTAAWCVTGYLSSGNMHRIKCAPAINTYVARFGSLANAYRLVGYIASHSYRYTKIRNHLRQIHRDIICQLISSAERNSGAVYVDEKSETLRINDEFTISIVIIPYLARNVENQGWRLHVDRLPRCDRVHVVRMSKLNDMVLDYHLFPVSIFSRPTFRFTDKNLSQFKPYKLKSISEVFRPCRTAKRRRALH